MCVCAIIDVNHLSFASHLPPSSHTHMSWTVHCVIGDIPHTLAPAASVPGLWTEVPTVAWFAAFCPRGYLPL